MIAAAPAEPATTGDRDLAAAFVEILNKVASIDRTTIGVIAVHAFGARPLVVCQTSKCPGTRWMSFSGAVAHLRTHAGHHLGLVPS